jgi:hypothetical protein
VEGKGQLKIDCVERVGQVQGWLGSMRLPLPAPPPPPSPPGQGQWGMGNHTIEGHTHLLKVVRVGGM